MYVIGFKNIFDCGSPLLIHLYEEAQDSSESKYLILTLTFDKVLNKEIILERLLLFAKKTNINRIVN